MDNVHIRKLIPEDAEEVWKIYASITQSPVKTDFKQIIQEYAHSDENACFVAEFEGSTVGFLISYILSVGFGAEKSAWVPLLGVSPKFMGQGIGKMMAEEMFKFYKNAGIKCVYTSVRWDSVDLLSFFKTLEFDRSNFINLRKIIDN